MSILPELYSSPKIPESTHHRPTIHGPHMKHDTDDQNYERNLLVRQKNGDVSIAIGAFADMDRLPNFDDIVAHPALLVPQKIPVDKDTILPYFPNLMEAVPSKLNSMPFVMAHNIPFHELQACVALHNWPHSIKVSPAQSDPYVISNYTFCNSQMLSQKWYVETDQGR
jgi:hypothetical protein